MTVAFLLAHQDDEIGVFHEIAATAERRERAICVYLTDGGWGDASPERRNAESRKVLMSLGVEPADIVSLGSEHGIADGGLVENLETVRSLTVECLRTRGPVDRIVMHGWEMGHHDHDAGHLVGLAVARAFGVLTASAQFPLYRPPASRLFITFAAPLAANGAVSRSSIPWLRRLRYLWLLRHFRSQARVIAQLLPAIMWDYCTEGCQKLQPVSLAGIEDRPVLGPPLYEGWNLYSYETFQAEAAPFIARYLQADSQLKGNTAPKIRHSEPA